MDINEILNKWIEGCLRKGMIDKAKDLIRIQDFYMGFGSKDYYASQVDRCIKCLDGMKSGDDIVDEVRSTLRPIIEMYRGFDDKQVDLFAVND